MLHTITLNCIFISLTFLNNNAVCLDFPVFLPWTVRTQITLRPHQIERVIHAHESGINVELYSITNHIGYQTWLVGVINMTLGRDVQNYKITHDSALILAFKVKAVRTVFENHVGTSGNLRLFIYTCVKITFSY